MSTEGSCPNGSPGCGFGGMNELALVEKIMQVIGSYDQDKRINPCPRCLRDTMLAVAGLLHLEAAKLDAAKQGKPPVKGKRFEDEFAKVARARLKAVAEAVPSNVIGFKQ